MKYQNVYDLLVEIAYAGKTISIDEISSQLCPELQSPQNRAEVNRVMVDIACTENAAGRPLLSAVVILPEIGYPAMPFFLLARELGVNRCSDERSFFGHELKRVHDFWKMHIPASMTTHLMTVFGREVRIIA